MASTQRVVFPDGAVSTTVLGTDLLPFPPAEEYLRFLRVGYSPNTVRSYATALAGWLTVLDATGHTWDRFPAGVFGDYLTFLRTRDLPGMGRISASAHVAAAATVQVRAAAVWAFYRWHADTHGLHGPHRALFTSRGRRRAPKYDQFLTGIADTSEPKPVSRYQVRTGPKSGTPLLLPGQIRVILDGCATHIGGEWGGGPAGLRDRLLFAVLAETGMRLGEALSLRHKDFIPGAGSTPSVDVIPRQDHPHGVRGKSRAPRRIYVGDDLERLYSAYVWQLVRECMDLEFANMNDHFVFVNLAHGVKFAPIRPETIYARCRSLNRRFPDDLPAGWTPHWFRHTHATALLLAGRPPHAVMRRLGHVDIQTTLGIYGWVTEDAELRALADWKQFAAAWKVPNDGNM